MGSWFSCIRSSSSRKSDNFIGKTTVRVVHLSGYVEDFEHPVLARDVAVKPGKHFVCTAAQLLSLGSAPMQPDSVLEPGRVYFLLPYSTLLNDNMSQVDLAAVVRRLTARARNARLSTDPTRLPSHPSLGGSGLGRLDEDNARALESVFAQKKSPRVSWKPILDTIREMSFDHRRSQSEFLMQEQFSFDNDSSKDPVLN